MKIRALIMPVLCAAATLASEQPVAPRVERLSEIGALLEKMRPDQRLDPLLARRGLISDQTTLRARSAQYLAHNGSREDVPYLIDSLADDSVHVVANYVYSGMATTRYWANVALIAICKVDLGFHWDDPAEKRAEAIKRWRLYCEVFRRKTSG